jgi:beta-glucanase (GH16 family)
MQCLSGCNPLASYKPTSCLADPICQDQNITFSPSDYNNTNMFMPWLQYNGNASVAPFILESGSLAPGSVGVEMQLTEARQTKLASTRYMLYGDVEVRMRHPAVNGLVAAFITMSDVLDEIDWEFVSNDTSEALTNFFWQGNQVSGNSATLNPSGLDVTAWHTFGLSWTPSRIQWSIDGTVVRTLRESQVSNFPSTPSMIQLSIWAGGNSTNAPGVIAWAGGEIDWTASAYTSKGYYPVELASYSVTCGDPTTSNFALQGSGTNYSSWVYNGVNTSTTPGILLSTEAMTFLKTPAAGGYAGVPGYEDQNVVPTGGWDGSGDTGVQLNSDGTIKTSGGSSGVSKEAALKYGVPIAAAVVGFIGLWALIIYIVRRRRRRANNASGPLGSGYHGKGGFVTSSRNASASGYKAIAKGADDEDWDHRDSMEKERNGSPQGEYLHMTGVNTVPGAWGPPTPATPYQPRMNYANTSAAPAFPPGQAPRQQQQQQQPRVQYQSTAPPRSAPALPRAGYPQYGTPAYSAPQTAPAQQSSFHTSNQQRPYATPAYYNTDPAAPVPRQQPRQPYPQQQQRAPLPAPTTGGPPRTSFRDHYQQQQTSRAGHLNRGSGSYGSGSGY